ncbi:MAG: LCP family protein [Clostridiales bacterium]|nr:LCP family protein [Clostridiales bacterium]
MSKPGRKKKKFLFVLEIIVLLVFIGGLYIYGQISSKLDKIEQPVLDEEKILVNEEAPEMTGYTTYALFGIDHRDKNAALGAENSDTMIIASVNNDTKEVKLVSLYRDTLLNVGDDTYTKINAAYAYGGPEQAISALNTNLDLDIKDYATVDFNALTEAVDAMGGLDIPLSYAEIEHMNNYSVETAEETGKSFTPVEKPDPAPENQEEIIGTYHLNGVQVTSYCRIRYTASLDMGRTERQRRVIQMLFMKAKSAGLSTLFKVMDDVFPMVQTSLTKNEILALAPSVIGYSIGETTGFPMEYKFANVKGSVIVPTSLESNVIALHKYLYGEDVVYTPSATVKERSEKILEIVGGEENIVDTAPVVEEDTTQDDFVWQAPSTDDGDTGYEPDYEPDYNPDQGGGDDGSGGGDVGGGDDGSGGGDVGGGDTGGGDVGGGDDGSGGGDVGGGDTGGGDTGGGDVGGGDDGSGGGDVGGGDTGGGDVGGGDTGGGDVGGGDTGGGDVGGGDTGSGDSDIVYQ